MTTRLLAFALAMLIGSPTCWCCVPHEAPSASKASHSCCHAAESDPGASSEPAKQKEQCPCATSLIKRDLATGKMLVPKLDSGVPTDFFWHQPSSALPASMTLRVEPPQVDEDPPWRITKLYERHCALLL